VVDGLAWERIKPWESVVVHVAAEFHRKYKLIDLVDIKQALYEWFLDHPNKLDTWEAIGDKDAKNLIYRSLRNQAIDYCQRWMAKSLGYEMEDLFYYRAEMVEALLPAILRGDDVDPPKITFGMPGRPPAPSEGGNLMAMMVEVEVGYNKLNELDKNILFRRYALSEDYVFIASEMEFSGESAARMRSKRAIGKLIKHIGGYRPHLEDDSDEQPNEIVETNNDSD